MAQTLSGSIVHVRGENWRVARVDAYNHCAVLTLDGGPQRRRLRIIEPFDRPRLCSSKLKTTRRRSVLRAALRTIAQAKPPLGLWTAAGAAIDLLPYQLEPALAVLGGATRLLLADAVGLGKTIEAGLILAELRARGWAERALILCPAGLRATWATELWRRFNITCVVFDQAAIAETSAALPPGVNPWTGHAVIVTSIDLAKRDEVRAALDEIPFDILIADEAHHLTPATDRGQAVHRLAKRTPWCVFVSATPHSGDGAAFTYLAGLGSHGDALTIFRRSRRDVGTHTDRREHIVRVRASDAETQLLESVAAYTRAIWRGNGMRDRAVQLVAITIAKRAASSPLALRRTLARRLALLDAPQEFEQASLPWEEDGAADGDVAAAVLARAGLEDARQEREAIEQLLSLLDRADAAKIAWLNRFLARAGEPAIVFTEYRDTLTAVLDALPSSLRTLAICGAHPPSMRKLAVDAFNHGGADVLVATDTAGEGLNLHRRCRLVIDMEVPWNPIRLEQRLGRVDRLGQTRRVHAVRLVHPDSIEDRILERVRERRHASETEVARWIFQEEALPAAPEWSPETVAVPVAIAEAQRLQRQRSAAPSAAGRVNGVTTRMRSNTPFIAVHRITFANGLGNVIAEYPAAHSVEQSAVSGLDRAITVFAGARCADIESQMTPLRSACGARLTQIRSLITAERDRAIQGSLFDDRAEAAARRADDVVAQLLAALSRRHESIASPLMMDGVSASLVAAWPPHRQ
jgi:superfamily II DNA or RNA helicase